MRILSIVFWVLATLFAAFWAFGYVYVMGLACAFSGPGGSQNCRAKAPWELHGEDLILLVLTPGAIFVILATIAYVLGRAAKRQKTAPADT